MHLCISGQFEIRAAIAHKKPLVLIRESIGLSSRLPRPLKGRAVFPADESDPRHGSYDFYAEQMAAPGECPFCFHALQLLAANRALPRAYCNVCLSCL